MEMLQQLLDGQAAILAQLQEARGIQPTYNKHIADNTNNTEATPELESRLTAMNPESDKEVVASSQASPTIATPTITQNDVVIDTTTQHTDTAVDTGVDTAVIVGFPSTVGISATFHSSVRATGTDATNTTLALPTLAIIQELNLLTLATAMHGGMLYLMIGTAGVRLFPFDPGGSR